MKRLWLIIGSVVVLIVFVVLGIALFSPKSFAVPDHIKREVTFNILIPIQSKNINVETDSMLYNTDLQLLTYTVKVDGIDTVISQQSSPKTFVDVPALIERVATSMSEYAKFESDSGTVYLTRPPDQHGKQTAVMNEQGILMFAKPASDLNEDQWRKLFNGLEIIK